MRLRKKAAIAAAALVMTAVLPVIPASGGPGSAMAAERSDAQSMLTSREWDIVRETNRYRIQAGLRPLSVTASVQRGADIRIQELFQENSHVRPNGQHFGTVLGEGGNYIAGENICAGFYTASEAMEAWMKSADHRENIMDSQFCHIGVRNKENYWEQLMTICDGNSAGTRLLTASQTPVVAVGTSVERLGYFIESTCSSCGETGLMPVTREMCSGYDPGMAGSQTVTVTCGGWTGMFSVDVREKNLIQEIRLSEKELQLRNFEKHKISAEIYPQEVDNPAVTWKTSNQSVAYVDGDNNIVGVTAGIAEIYAVANDEGKTESERCVVTVSQTVTDIWLNSQRMTLAVGDQVELEAAVKPENAADRSVQWHSEDPQVAVVDQTGQVTAVAVGNTKIYCVSRDGSNVQSGKCSVTVREKSGWTGSSGYAGSGSGEADSSGNTGSGADDRENEGGGAGSGSGGTSGSGNTGSGGAGGSGDTGSGGAGGSGSTGSGSSTDSSGYIDDSGMEDEDSRDSGADGYSSADPGQSEGRLPSYVVRGSWSQNGDGSWSFTDSSQRGYAQAWAAVENPYADSALGQQAFDWFRFDGGGRMVTGWFYDGADWYYLNPVSDNTLGRMITGWRQIDGIYYYFNPYSDGTRGRMYANETTPDGYYVDSSGRWLP